MVEQSTIEDILKEFMMDYVSDLREIYENYNYEVEKVEATQSNMKLQIKSSDSEERYSIVVQGLISPTSVSI